MKMCFQKLVCKLVVLLAGFLFCFLLGSPIFAATFDRVVARVNNDVITLGTLEDRVAVFSSRMETSGSVDEQLPKKKLMNFGMRRKHTLDASSFLDQKNISICIGMKSDVNVIIKT